MSRQAMATALLGIVTAVPAHADWLMREFNDTWDAPGSGVQEFLNRDCRPSGLDGIQLIGVQSGHDDIYHVHVYCRHDNAAGVHYAVSLVPVTPRGAVDQTVRSVLDRPNVRLGPFYFGQHGKDDGFLLIEKAP